MKEKIENALKKSLISFDIEADEIAVENPSERSFGDYSTNVALIYSKEKNLKPHEFAQIIKESLEKEKIYGIEKIEIAGPGFINFYLSKDFFKKSIGQILLEDENFGKTNTLAREKIIIEYTDPNPFKEFHIGHLMPNVIGEALSRMIEANGAEVKRACYQGDVGLHVAKAIAFALKNDGKDVSDGGAYAKGNKKYEEDESFKKFVQEINKKIYSREDKEINKIYDEGKKMSLEYFGELYRRLDTKFDYFFFESEAAKVGKEIIQKNIGAIFEESEGAIVFHAENYDPTLHTRVFINSDGLPTYEAKELALAKMKYDKFPYTKSIVVTGNEIKEYFRVLLAAMKFIFPELREKTKHIPHGMLRLPGGKMSSRTGSIITAEWLITAVKDAVSRKGELQQMDEKEREEIKEKIAIGAIKYMILRQGIGNDIIFDFEKSVSIDGDSGPYLQYTLARTNSVLKKATQNPNANAESKETYEIEKLLHRFPEVVERARKEYAPNQIITYLTELAGSFNNFYSKVQIISDSKESPYLLAITKAFNIVLRNGLNILGIPSPERM